MTRSISDKAVCRTAPATPGLLKKSVRSIPEVPEKCSGLFIKKQAYATKKISMTMATRPHAQTDD